MDHLPLPHRARIPYPKVPCLCARQDNATNNLTLLSLAELVPALDHEEIPGLQEAFSRGYAREASLDIFSPFLQSWLWFGTIEKVFSTVGVAVQLTDFIGSDDVYGHRLDTSLLHRYLWYWVAAEAGVSSDLQTKHDKEIIRHLSIVYSALRNYCINDNLSESEASRVTQEAITDNDNNILLSISLLAEFIDYARFRIYNSDTQRWWMPLQLVQWLFEAGWCDSEAEARPLRRTTTISALLYLSRVSRSLHSKSHRGCSIDNCAHPSLNPATYRPVHVDEDCLCSDIGLHNTQKLEMEILLRNGKYPVITYSGTDAFGCLLKVHEPTIIDGIMKYVAISHVWSDGLGNLHENALPACQLHKIQYEVNSLYPQREGDIPFWIDTVCVPREDATRRLAIQSMRKVYEQAEKVLVFDSILRSIHSTASAEEVLLAVRLSPWSERLWTWHESVLARSIFFQLQEGAVNGDKLYEGYHTNFSSHPAVVGLASLIGDRDGPNQALCRALVRAMTLSRDDALSDGSRPYANSTDMTESAPDANEPSRSMLYVGGLKVSMRIPVKSDDEDPTDLISLGFTTSVKRSGLASELESRKSAMEDYGATTSEPGVDSSIDENQTPFPYHELRFNGFFYRQKVTSALPQASIPREWLARKSLSPSETRLCQMIGNIVRVTSICRYWLKSFDPVFGVGGGRYLSLRTATRSIRATESLESPISDQAGRVCYRELEEVLSAISERTTSWIEDEAICLGIVLDFEPGKLYQTEPSKRMEVLVRMWNSVPRTLLFVPGPRMGEQGLRWMPKSLLNCNERFVLPLGGNRLTRSGARKATRTKHGLLLQGLGAFIIYGEMHETDNADLLFLHNDEGDCFAISKSVTQQAGRGELGANMECAIIFEDVPESRTLYKAALVAVRRQDASVIFANLIGHVAVIPLDEREKDLILGHSLKHASRKAAFTSIQQLWCID